ncbi:MAG: efflux RND transporter periplasmic adaptor subunit [Clostridium sp.]
MWKWKKENDCEPEEAQEIKAFEFAEEKAEKEVQEMLQEYLQEDHSGGKKSKRIRKRDWRSSWKAFCLRVSGWSRKRKIMAGLGLAFAAVLFLPRLSGKGEEGVSVQTIPLERGDVRSVLTLSGPVSGTDSADVVSNLHAEVLEILVKEGDRVEKDQVLARIDGSDAGKAVDMAQNAYELAVSEYEENKRDTQAGYEKARQDYQAARLAFDRNTVLFQAGDISRAELEGVENALRDAARQVESYTIKDGKAVPDASYELKIKSAQFELDQKKEDLAGTEVKSPIAGTVTRVNSRIGQFADEPEDDKPMFMIENLENLEMEIAVSEYSIGSVRLDQSVVIQADILGDRTAEGRIVSISPTGEEKGGGSTERVVPTTIQIEGGSKTGLIAGITAKASITTGEGKGVLKVPQTALIQQENGSQAVAAVRDGRVHMIPVRTGVESDLEAEISPVQEGTLTEGMEIITSPSGLTEGMAVTAAGGKIDG